MERMDAGLYDKGRRSRPVVGLDDVRRLQDIVRHVYMDRALMLYASELVAVTRAPDEHLPQAARPPDRVRRQPTRDDRVLQVRARAGSAVRAGRTCMPDDIAKLAHRVLRHRLILGFEAASNGVTPEVVIDAVLQAVRVP